MNDSFPVPPSPTVLHGLAEADDLHGRNWKMSIEILYNRHSDWHDILRIGQIGKMWTT